MAIVTTNSEHYEAIADVIRERLGTNEKYKPEKMADRVGEAINKAYEDGKAEGGGGDYDQGYNDGFVDGEEQGKTDGYRDGWDHGESSGTHDGFGVGVGLGDDVKEVEVFTSYEFPDIKGTYPINIDNPKQLVITTTGSCDFYTIEITDANGTTHGLTADGTIQLERGTHTFDFPDEFVCNADDGYGEVYLEGYYNGIVGVSVTNKMSYAEGVEQGKTERDLEWWNDYQGVDDEETYLSFLFAGYRWGAKTFTPQFDIKCYHTSTALATQMFYQHNANGTPYDMAAHLDELGVVLDTSKFAAMGQCFRYAAISRVGTIDTTAITSTANSAHLFANSKLVTIDKIVTKTRSYDWSGNEFLGCSLLENLTIDGEIGNNKLNFTDCPLTNDSLMSIIKHLKDFSGTGETRSITFGASNLAKLSDADKQKATGKGWTLL